MSLPDYLKGSEKESEAVKEGTDDDMTKTAEPEEPNSSEDLSEPSSPDKPEVPEE